MPHPLLALDLSTKTGWAYFSAQGKLTQVGSFTHKIDKYAANIKSWKDFPSEYPWNFMDTSVEVSNSVRLLAMELNCPKIVIEMTEGSRHRISQRTLEFIHYAVLNILQTSGYSSTKLKYILNSDWRRDTRCYISQWPEFVKYNKEVSKAKKKSVPNKAGAKVAKIAGKVVSKYDAKKISIHIAKTNYPLFADRIGSNDDIADAINLGHAAYNLGVFDD